jgi:cAMP phosphodiesterase
MTDFLKFRIQRSFRMMLLLLFWGSCAHAQNTFKVIPLGVKGGSDESNLSSYAIAAGGTGNYVCLDAGTLHSGIRKAIETNVWRGDAADILKNSIKGYLISHPHFDHVSGLVINSPDDSPKPIYGTASCLNVLKEKYFSWKNWANFANEGEKPTLNKYTYTLLAPAQEHLLQGTSMFATAFTLSHVSPNESTAFLIRHEQSYLLYLGDTGSDKIEKSGKLQLLWQAASPLIKSKQLKAIFIEVSFANEQPDHLLFGHLTPGLLMQELNILSNLCGKESLKDFPIIVTHMKPGGNREATIVQQLKDMNSLGVKLIFPQQGQLLEF